MSRRLRAALLAAGAAACGHAAAHPDGAIDCALALRFDGSALQGVDLELTLDAEHSKQVLQSLPAADDLAGPRGEATRAHIGSLFGAADWLLELRQDGRPLRMAAGAPPQLRRADDGRIVAAVALAVQSDAVPAEASTLNASCRDASWYWFAGFDAPQRISSSGRSCAVSLGEARTSAVDAVARAHDALIECRS